MKILFLGSCGCQKKAVPPVLPPGATDPRFHYAGFYFIDEQVFYVGGAVPVTDAYGNRFAKITNTSSKGRPYASMVTILGFENGYPRLIYLEPGESYLIGVPPLGAENYTRLVYFYYRI